MYTYIYIYLYIFIHINTLSRLLSTQLRVSEKDRGLLVDTAMMTSVQGVFAAGDVCTAGWQLSPYSGGHSVMIRLDWFGGEASISNDFVALKVFSSTTPHTSYQPHLTTPTTPHRCVCGVRQGRWACRQESQWWPWCRRGSPRRTFASNSSPTSQASSATRCLLLNVVACCMLLSVECCCLLHVAHRCVFYVLVYFFMLPCERC